MENWELNWEIMLWRMHCNTESFFNDSNNKTFFFIHFYNEIADHGDSKR